MLPPVGIEPRASDFHAPHSELIPYLLKSQTFRFLHSHALLIFWSREFFDLAESSENVRGMSEIHDSGRV